MSSFDLKASLFLLATVLVGTSVAKTNLLAEKGRPIQTSGALEAPRGSTAQKLLEIISLDKGEVETKKPFSKENQEETLREFRKFMGGLNGGGGDEVGLEFEGSLRYALGVIKRREPELYQKMKGRGLDEILPTLRYVVIGQPIRVMFRNLTQDSTAAYDPRVRVIVIDRDRWNKIPNARIQQALALHELAGILGLEQTGEYFHSSLYSHLMANTVCDSVHKETEWEGTAYQKQMGMRITLLHVNMKDGFMPQQVGLVFDNTYNDGSTRPLSAPPRDAFGDYIPGMENTFRVVDNSPAYQPIRDYAPGTKYVRTTIEESAKHLISGRHVYAANEIFTVFDFRRLNSKVYLRLSSPDEHEFFKKFQSFICETIFY
jgi:hypothetical protein